MTETRADRPSRSTVLLRWPTALAVATAGLVALAMGENVSEEVHSFSAVLLLLPLEYLIVAKLGRRDATWPVIGVLAVITAALSEQHPILRSSIFAALALLVLVWAAVDGQLFRPGEFQIQTAGMIGFAVLTVVGLTIDADLGRYVVAAGWLLHGTWDFIYLWRDKVVPRSYAEWCGVLDILIAFGLVFLL